MSVTLDGAQADYAPFMAAMTPDTAPPFLVEMYAAFSPDGPDHFPTVFEKLHTMWLAETGIELTDLERVAAPTLILNGDEGAMTLEHAGAVQRALPESQLAVVPGT